MLIGE